MIDLFYMGGPLFMGILTIIFIAVIATAVYLFILKGKDETNVTLSKITLVKEIGIFGLVMGIFAQFIGMFQAFKAIEQIGTVSPAMLMGGLKVSSVPTLYGFVIFLISYLLYFALKISVAQK